MPEAVSVPGPASRPKVVVAGASGFVGRALIENLARDFDVIALTRSARAKSIQLALPSNLMNVGVSFSYFGYSLYHEMLCGLGFARNFSD